MTKVVLKPFYLLLIILTFQSTKKKYKITVEKYEANNIDLKYYMEDRIMTEIWEKSFIENQMIWGFEPAPSR